jgi:hypothetical protein
MIVLLSPSGLPETVSGEPSMMIACLRICRAAPKQKWCYQKNRALEISGGFWVQLSSRTRLWCRLVKSIPHKRPNLRDNYREKPEV